MKKMIVTIALLFSWETDYSDNKTYVGFTDELWKRNNIYGKVGIVYRF